MKFKEEKWELLFRWLIEKKETIATMESCTGGYLANMITNHPGASNIFKLGIVSYATEMKILCGVSKEVIEKYTVYSKQTACDMAKCISKKANTNYGIGVTGKLEPGGVTYICVYDLKKDISYYRTVSFQMEDRASLKTAIANLVIDLLCEVVEII